MFSTHCINQNFRMVSSVANNHHPLTVQASPTFPNKTAKTRKPDTSNTSNIFQQSKHLSTAWFRPKRLQIIPNHPPIDRSRPQHPHIQRSEGNPPSRLVQLVRSSTSPCADRYDPRRRCHRPSTSVVQRCRSSIAAQSRDSNQNR